MQVKIIRVKYDLCNLLEDDIFEKINPNVKYSDGKKLLSGLYYKLNDLKQLKTNGFIEQSSIHFDKGLIKLKQEYGVNYVKITEFENGNWVSIRIRNLNYEYHCETGPAVSYNDGRCYYYLKARLLNEQQWEEQIATKLYW